MSSDAQELYQDGYDRGAQWAARGNVQRELRRLRRFAERTPPYEWHMHFQDGAAALAVVWIIEPRYREDRQAARDYWQEIAGIGGTDAWEPEFILGFVEGALGIERQMRTETEGADEALPRGASAALRKQTGAFGRGAHRCLVAITSPRAGGGH